MKTIKIAIDVPDDTPVMSLVSHIKSHLVGAAGLDPKEAFEIGDSIRWEVSVKPEHKYRVF